MHIYSVRGRGVARGVSLLALAMVSMHAEQAWAQDGAPVQVRASGEADAEHADDVVVSASRVARAGFDAPTPTTVIGELEIRAGNRRSVAEILNDLPQFVPSGTPTLTPGNTNANSPVANLRGLGDLRTLTLVNGHRTMATEDLNLIPPDIIRRIDVVTGGASAAWGSGAVAGVVNFILDDKLDGLRVGVDSGVSSRGDGARYGASLSYGTSFAGGRGHILGAVQYNRDQGIFERDGQSRPNLDVGAFVTNDGRLFIKPDVNALYATRGGVIADGPLAGMAFNADGTLRPAPRGTETNGVFTVGGEGDSQTDNLPVSAPFHRANAYARASYEVSDAAKFWIDARFMSVWDDYPSFPEAEYAYPGFGGLVFQKDNPFLSPAVRAAMAAGPQTFRLGRFFGDPGGMETSRYRRNTYEAAIGVNGSLGGGWAYDAYFSHGEKKNREAFYNQRITANFNNAIDAVLDPSGRIVCRVALTDPGTACRPLNLFGMGNASPEAVAYAFAGTDQVYMYQSTRLDAGGVSLRGDPFSTWAGPVSIAIGAEARWEEIITDKIDPLQTANALGSFNMTAPSGGFNVKEVFGEFVSPLINIPGTLSVELNGAARYSHYSTSGGIWSWKAGGTARIAKDFLLRTVYSRDIRSPSIGELFSPAGQLTTSIIDSTRNNEIVPVLIMTGGNAKLVPETSHTLTIGGSYSPGFIPNLRLSADFYNIKMQMAITTVGASDLITLCGKGVSTACSSIIRNNSGQIAKIYDTYQNLAIYDLRGLDLEADYMLPLNNISKSMKGALRIRSLVNYVDKVFSDTGISAQEVSGDLASSLPKWRAVVTVGYESDNFSADVRARYVGRGVYAKEYPIVNNDIPSQTYFDINASYTIGAFTINGSVNNVFDRGVPLPYGNVHDLIGRYFSGGVKLRF